MADRGRIIGILGGMGPEATLDLYRYIIMLTPASRDQDHFRVLIYSNPKIPERTKAIVDKGESPLHELIESAERLQQGGAGIIAMACNTAHYFLPEIRRHVSIPFLDMIEETCRKLRETAPGLKTAGLLAATGTVHSALYHRTLAGAGIRVLTPPVDIQERIQEAIGRVKAGVASREIQDLFQSAGARLIENGAEAVILGCTEIPLAFSPDKVDYRTVNSTRALAEAAVAWAASRG